METYMMMLYVSIEQEKALKQFFLDNDWEYCKPDLSALTDSIGPLVAQVPHIKKQPVNETSNMSPSKNTTLHRTVKSKATARPYTRSTSVSGVSASKSECLPATSGEPKTKKRKLSGSQGHSDTVSTQAGSKDGINSSQSTTVNLDGTMTVNESEATGGSTVTLLIEVDRNLLTGESNEEKSKEFIEIAREALKMNESSEVDSPSEMPDESTSSQDIAEVNTVAVCHKSDDMLTEVKGDQDESNSPLPWYFEHNGTTMVMKKLNPRPGPVRGECDADKGPFKCDICDKEYAVRTSLQRHQKSHQTGLERCMACNQYFLTADDLYKHNEKYHPGMNLCESCGAEFSRKSALRKHTLKFHPERVDAKFTCTFDTCNAAFDNENLYNDHLNIHQNNRPYTCKVCHKCFPFESSLKTHLAIHSADLRDFKCDQCELSFKSSGALSNHRSSVHENTRYICHCGKTFKYKPGLIKHMKQLHEKGEGSIDLTLPGTIFVETEIRDEVQEIVNETLKKV